MTCTVACSHDTGFLKARYSPEKAVNTQEAIEGKRNG